MKELSNKDIKALPRYARYKYIYLHIMAPKWYDFILFALFGSLTALGYDLQLMEFARFCGSIFILEISFTLVFIFFVVLFSIIDFVRKKKGKYTNYENI